MEQRPAAIPEDAWREITVAQGSQGPRIYLFSAQRVRATKRRKPGEEVLAVYPRNLDGSEPRYTCPMLRRIRRWRPWPTWAVPGGASNRSLKRKRATWGWRI